MINVRRNNGSSERHFIANKFRGNEFGNTGTPALARVLMIENIGSLIQREMLESVVARIKTIRYGSPALHQSIYSSLNTINLKLMHSNYIGMVQEGNSYGLVWKKTETAK